MYQMQVNAVTNIWKLYSDYGNNYNANKIIK